MLQNEDTDLNVGVESVVAIPLDDWSLDYVTPGALCVKNEGQCLPFNYPNPPDQSKMIAFVGEQVCSLSA